MHKDTSLKICTEVILVNYRYSMLTKKQLLMLFLISGDPGVRGIYTLMKLFDRADFPSKIRENIDALLSNGFVIIFERFDNGTEKSYQTTKEGKEYLRVYFSISEILQYIQSMDHPALILEITKSYIDKSQEAYRD